MNIYYAGFFGLLPAVAIAVILIIKKRRRVGFGVLAVFCVAASLLLTSGILYSPQEPEMPPDELLRLCRLYLESGDSTSLPGGFITADSEEYERIIKARPELGTELGSEKSDPVSAEFCRRLRSSVSLCSDKQAAYITLAQLEFDLGHIDAAEAALGGAFSYVPGYADAEPYISVPGFADFAGDTINRRNTLFDHLASCPPDGRIYNLQSSLVYMTGAPVTLALSGDLHEKESFALLIGRRNYMTAVSDIGITLPADTESGEYTLMISDGVSANTSPQKLYVTRGMTETDFGDYIFTSCAVYTADSVTEMEGLVTLGDRLHFNGGITVREKDGAATLSFQSAAIVFDETSPLYGGALIVTPEKAAESKGGSPFVFIAQVTAGEVRLDGVTVTLYNDRIELTRNGDGGILSDAVSAMLSGEYVSAEINGDIGGGKLFLPYTDMLPPVLEIKAATEEGLYYIITGKTEAGCSLAVNGKSVTAEQGSFVYKTAAAGYVLLMITAEDKAGNRTLREILLEKDKLQKTVFSLYSFAPFFIAFTAVAVNSAAAAFFIADDRILRRIKKYRRRIFSTAAVFCIAAAASLIANAFSETAKIASSAFIITAKASPAIAYEIIKGRDNSFISAAVLMILFIMLLAAGVYKKKG
ncbi:MAG: hypothetical protein ACYCWE_02370 [Eubacteriales bacterium]